MLSFLVVALLLARADAFGRFDSDLCKEQPEKCNSEANDCCASQLGDDSAHIEPQTCAPGYTSVQKGRFCSWPFDRMIGHSIGLAEYTCIHHSCPQMPSPETPALESMAPDARAHCLFCHDDHFAEKSAVFRTCKDSSGMYVMPFEEIGSGGVGIQSQSSAAAASKLGRRLSDSLDDNLCEGKQMENVTCSGIQAFVEQFNTHTQCMYIQDVLDYMGCCDHSP